MHSLQLELPPFKTACYGKLGCFHNGPPFYNPRSNILPLKLLPLPPVLYLTRYYFYSRRNMNEPFLFTPYNSEALLSSPFNSSLQTRILIAGFLEGDYSINWLQELKDAYLSWMDNNVIIADFGPTIPYSQASVNTRGEGAQVSLLLRFIQKSYKYPAEKFHIVGHSLGAQIAGYIGQRIPRLGRITALDPAGPGFLDLPSVAALDPSDALLVDVIHSNPGRIIIDGLGNPKDVGHVNFWPGGGRPRGCALTLLRHIVTGSRISDFVHDLFGCQHRRSIELMLFSFGQNGCLMVGVECLSYEAFLKGECNCGKNGERCRFMGQFSTPAPQKSRYYLQIGYERPYYCLFQYQVIVYFELVPGQITYESAEVNLDLTLKGDINIQESRKFYVNLIKTRQFQSILITSKVPLGKPKSGFAAFYRSVNQAVNKQSPGADFGAVIRAIEINYLYPLPKKHISTLLCKKEDLPQTEKKLTTFSADACNYHFKQEWKNSTLNFATWKAAGTQKIAVK
ncbi:pancreatic triacylglycerol lipase-like isoform X2 [Stegodyphus dumicola]|uniref:pancreatic triacylglycerol lipase-like isoform X2 n=1 Tax=Stegodyphus dumicola TaxID=202533 RepID=UPI0015AA7F0B|nr:pancreatic triacylglycerol lipase-like isoform X2 [Stegodyphus dumicola]